VFSFDVDPLTAVLIIHAVLFLMALVLVLRSSIYSSAQKWIQTLFALFIPILGPGIVLAVAISDRLKVKLQERTPGQSINEHFAKYYGGWFNNH
jgi:regulator of protease activity HflC (stomatin/prohibitin superfamily)